jgi:hypothetical protein
MSSWLELLNEIKTAGGPHDRVRRKYIKRLSEKTGRNVIVYYSGWLDKAHLANQVGNIFSINDSDKNGFMASIHNLDRDKGLDLVLHTPGGSIAATESLVDYLRKMFNNNIRAIIPQIAMSAGTMVSLSCGEIIMGKHSNLGPIDPQIANLPAHGILEEAEQAKAEILKNPQLQGFWMPILQKYSPSLIGECKKSIEWSEKVVKKWLCTGMFKNDDERESKADHIIEEMGSHAVTLSHGRHLSFEDIKALKINVTALENDQDLQDAVLCVHHTCTQTINMTNAVKIIENQHGVGHLLSIGPIVPR